MVTTVSPRPVQRRSDEPNDRELFGLVYRQARYASSCLEPDEWFPLTANVGRARKQAARCTRHWRSPKQSKRPLPADEGPKSPRPGSFRP